jgi:hypothetical protein
MGTETVAVVTKVDDSRVDAFIRAVKDFPDGRQVIGTKTTALDVGTSIADNATMHRIQVNLSNTDVRIEFADYLNERPKAAQPVSAANIDQLVDEFIASRRANSLTAALWNSASDDTVKNAINSCSDEYFDHFGSESERMMIIKFPTAAAASVARFDAPMRSVEDAMAAFEAFKEHSAVVAQCGTERQKALCFMAAREGAGIQDDGQLLGDFLKQIVP